MVTQFDEKGKIYTNVVQKQPLWVTIQLQQNRIHGLIHIRAGERIMDELDKSQTFIAVTQAEVFSPDGQESLFSSRFLAINKTHIVWLIPDDDRI